MDLITSDGLRKFVHEMRLKKVYSLSDLKLIQLGQHADHETLCQIMKKDMSPHMKEIRTHFEKSLQFRIVDKPVKHAMDTKDEENLFVKDIEKLLKFSREHHGMDIPMDLITSDGLRKFVHEMRLKKVYSLSDLKLIQLGQHADHETLCQIMKKDMSPHMKEIRTHFEKSLQFKIVDEPVKHTKMEDLNKELRDVVEKQDEQVCAVSEAVINAVYESINEPSSSETRNATLTKSFAATHSLQRNIACNSQQALNYEFGTNLAFNHQRDVTFASQVQASLVCSNNIKHIKPSFSSQKILDDIGLTSWEQDTIGFHHIVESPSLSRSSSQNQLSLTAYSRQVTMTLPAGGTQTTTYFADGTTYSCFDKQESQQSVSESQKRALENHEIALQNSSQDHNTDQCINGCELCKSVLQDDMSPQEASTFAAIGEEAKEQGEIFLSCGKKMACGFVEGKSAAGLAVDFAVNVAKKEYEHWQHVKGHETSLLPESATAESTSCGPCFGSSTGSSTNTDACPSQ